MKISSVKTWAHHGRLEECHHGGRQVRPVDTLCRWHSSFSCLPSATALPSCRSHTTATRTLARGCKVTVGVNPKRVTSAIVAAVRCSFCRKSRCALPEVYNGNILSQKVDAQDEVPRTIAVYKAAGWNVRRPRNLYSDRAHAQRCYDMPASSTNLRSRPRRDNLSKVRR